MKSPEMRFSEHVPVIKRHVTVYKIKKYSFYKYLLNPIMCWAVNTALLEPAFYWLMKKKENELEDKVLIKYFHL